ncbi:hypothetical protein [Burkholderia pseudomallei]|uniref:hypothetical protein n=1 Tax=Burkholderia pseudomallei TaxID=28450 RepID=UPI0005E4A5FC|nr:hypothetical protein [Burkholderia pseudomallei]QGS82531.1 hypothetical protein PMC2000_29360 [Burkholderia pseudomallei]CAJ4728806.1 Uncharacterised protein [Burkholderia pseudomallei]CAK0010757.1 Uncharacterised protein [Burkholderia pseudomallei]CAK0066842.1 Uncharacterised protein [Burkholderia pseudomallei]CFK42825.1 Uncharacterised protein [Burkholderia pseudomallei]
MKTAIATIKGVSPYSQSKHYSTEKLPKELAKDYETRTWRDRLHATDDGTVFIPPMSFKNCLSEAAKFLSLQIPGKGKATYTKHFEAGVLVTDALHLDIKKDDVPGEWLFVPADGIRGSGKRVEKCFPVIHQWSGDVTFHILDETITRDVFEHVLTQAGAFIGIGRFRPRNNGFYGRFKLESLNWQ